MYTVKDAIYDDKNTLVDFFVDLQEEENAIGDFTNVYEKTILIKKICETTIQEVFNKNRKKISYIFECIESNEEVNFFFYDGVNIAPIRTKEDIASFLKLTHEDMNKEYIHIVL